MSYNFLKKCMSVALASGITVALAFTTYATEIIEEDITTAISVVETETTTTETAETTIAAEETTEPSTTTAVTPEMLEAPVITSATNEDGYITLSWKKVNGADSYAVYKKDEKNNFVLVKAVNEAVYTDKDVTAGKKYTYKVVCVDKSGKEISKKSQAYNTVYVEKPVIKSIKNTADGVKITWSKSKGASKYRVYYLNSKKTWSILAKEVSGTEYTHKNIKTGKTYTYSVRCLDKDGNKVSSFDKNGTSNLFLTSPEITSVKSIYGGVEIKWEKRSGAESYKVYKKAKDGKWTEIKTTKENSYTDKKVEHESKYTYTVRCADKNGNVVSAQIKGVSVKYIKTPVIKKIENQKSSAVITWSEVNGVTKYAVYSLNSKNEWKKLATVSGNTYTHKKLTDGKTYSYKVKALDKEGKAVSGEKVATNLFLKPLELSKITGTKKGTKIEWKSVKGVASYRVYRKTFSGEWKKIADVKKGKSYVDEKANAKEIYAYTVCAVNEKGKNISYYNEDVKYYTNGKLADNSVTVGKDTYNFKDGVVSSSLITKKGYKYYYGKDGKLQKNGIVGSEKTGYWYADKNGKIDTNYVDGLKINGKEWIITNGQALPVKTKHHGVFYRAAIEVTKATNTSMTKEEKLKACFDYVKGAYIEKNPRVPHYLGDDWPIIYADDMFITGVGNCCSYGAAFAHMAYVIGYRNVYCCNSGGHGWAEIEGLVYDPEWSRHRFKYSYYALSYDTKTDQNYKGAIAAGKSWMHVKIEY